ncbi:hypothetical protein BROUX41_001781 [Berkeleyomyces rouxiae]|uniref:uncharacterized protein n=1 Tax=Berkeleyomyces rouxiae TaxID=2035830 RepID=UPI003B7F580A
MSPSTSHSELTMQYFLQLQAQHSALMSQIDAHRASSLEPCFTASSATIAGPTATATSPSTMPSSPFALSREHSRSSRRSSLNASTSLDLWPWANEELDVQAEERQLSNVNEDIKRTLTELLNCDDVRKDNNRRLWVQSRLMETERELRSGRRRRSAASSEA